MRASVHPEHAMPFERLGIPVDGDQLLQLGIAPELIAPTFLILLSAVAGALALAFGFGGQETAAKLIAQWYGKGKEAASKIPSSGNSVKEVRRSNGPGSRT